MPCKKIAVSHLHGEWWYGHLAGSLARRVAVENILPAEGRHPGYSPAANLADLLAGWEPDDSVFLGSIRLIFPGISRLPMRTAVWTDYIPQCRGDLPALRLFDQVFCTQKDSVELLRKGGCRQVCWLPFALSLIHI